MDDAQFGFTPKTAPAPPYSMPKYDQTAPSAAILSPSNGNNNNGLNSNGSSNNGVGFFDSSMYDQLLAGTMSGNQSNTSSHNPYLKQEDDLVGNGSGSRSVGMDPMENFLQLDENLVDMDPDAQVICDGGQQQFSASGYLSSLNMKRTAEQSFGAATFNDNNFDPMASSFHPQQQKHQFNLMHQSNTPGYIIPQPRTANEMDVVLHQSGPYRPVYHQMSGSNRHATAPVGGQRISAMKRHDALGLTNDRRLSAAGVQFSSTLHTNDTDNMEQSYYVPGTAASGGNIRTPVNQKVSQSTSQDEQAKAVADARKRSRSEPGTTLRQLEDQGVDVTKLDPTVIKRIKNTDAARKSRLKKLRMMQDLEMQTKTKEEQLSAMTQERDHYKEKYEQLRKLFYQQEEAQARLRKHIAEISNCASPTPPEDQNDDDDEDQDSNDSNNSAGEEGEEEEKK